MLEIIFITALIIYGLRTVLFIIGSEKENNKQYKPYEESDLPFVSVVIPSRNEEENIASCLESVLQTDYPTDKFEVIAVNDRSSDNTKDIIEKYTKENDNIILVDIIEKSEATNLQGKPGALHEGILQSRGEIIIMTDADGVVQTGWIRNIVRAYNDEKTGLVASYTTISGKRPFDKMQGVEWAYTHTMASAAIGLDQTLGCYGNNLSVRASDYNNVGGYENISFSVTEDLALLQAIRKSGKNIHYMAHPEATVTTKPCINFKEFVNQHHRWTIGGLGLGWRAVFFVVTTAALWIGIILSLIFAEAGWLAAIFGLRILADILLIGKSLIKIKRKSLLPWLLPSILFLMVWELIVPFLLLKKDVKWKGQVFKKQA
jgi:cellulose synthase/poly-beta-1,6-N-acetylglucosamine synthase-like glycosyltransferase